MGYSDLSVVSRLNSSYKRKGDKMGLRKRIATALSAVTVLLVTSVGTVDFASARMRLDDFLEDEEIISPVVTTTCAEAQSAINSIERAGEVEIGFTENCAMSLTIPRGKKIGLTLDFVHAGEEGYDDFPYFLDIDEDNITVEEGATLVLEGGGIEIWNDTEGKAIINNKGTVYLSGMFHSVDGVYTFSNAGELNVLNGIFYGTKFQNIGTGKIRLAGGAFENAREAEPYIVGAASYRDELENWVSVYIPEGALLENAYIGDSYWPVGAVAHIRGDYPELLDLYGTYFASTNEEVLQVSGSNQEGWTFTMVGVGEAEIIFHNKRTHGTRNHIVVFPPEEGNPAVICTTCADVQNVLNHAFSNSRVIIEENCKKNIVIPAGKNITLQLYMKYTSEVGPTYFENYTLTDDGGDTITVEEGATLWIEGTPGYDGLPGSVPTVRNTTNGKAAIRNYGTVRVGTNVEAENGAYLAMNAGKLYTLGGVYDGGTFMDIDNGRTYVAKGVFDNAGDVRPYIVNGMKLDEETGQIVSALPDGRDPLIALDDPSMLAEKKFPVGYSFTTEKDYADFADAMALKFGYVGDESVLKITGSNQDGWTFTTVGVGYTCAGFSSLFVAGDIGCMTGYEVPLQNEGGMVGVVENLFEKFDGFKEELRQAIENGELISVKVDVQAMFDVDAEVDSAIREVLGNDTLAKYYNIRLLLKGGNEEIAEIHELDDEPVEVRIPASLMKDVPSVKPGYKRDYYVIRYHEGVAEKLNAKLEGDELVFRSGKFSTYAVAYSDTQISNRPIGGGSSIGGNSGANSGSILRPTVKPNGTINNGFIMNNTNKNNPDITAPDTGVAMRFSNNRVSVLTVGVIMVLSVTSGVIAGVEVCRRRCGKRR